MATNETHSTPFRAVHPAEIIKDEFKARGMTQKELAKRMGMQPSNLSRLLKGENITASIAQKLEEALEIPADFWMRLQTQYDKDVKSITVRDEKEKAAINTETMLSNILNLTELYKRLNISPSLYIQEKLEFLKQKLGFEPLDIHNQEFTKPSNISFKKSDKAEIDERNQTTWLTLAYIASRANNPGGKFTKGNAKIAAQAIVQKAHKGNLKEAEIKAILNQYCIAYSVVPKLEKTPIDAASMDMGSYPAIITTHRYNDMSRLIFNILHELGHIEKHMYGEEKEIFVSGEHYSTGSTKEKEVNEFAQNMLIDQKLWNSMMNSGPVNGLRFGNLVTKLRALSKEHNLNFDIVVWRWKYESHNYQLKDTRPVPIR